MGCSTCDPEGKVIGGVTYDTNGAYCNVCGNTFGRESKKMTEEELSDMLEEIGQLRKRMEEDNKMTQSGFEVNMDKIEDEYEIRMDATSADIKNDLLKEFGERYQEVIDDLIYFGKDSIEGIEEGRITDRDRLFTVGDLWGPLSCEVNRCGNSTYTIKLSVEENERLPEPTDTPVAITYIFNNRLGTAMCRKCLVAK